MLRSGTLKTMKNCKETGFTTKAWLSQIDTSETVIAAWVVSVSILSFFRPNIKREPRLQTISRKPTT